MYTHVCAYVHVHGKETKERPEGRRGLMCVYKIREQGKTRRWERWERASHWHGATRRQYLRAALNPPAVSGRLSVGIRPVVRHGIVQGCARVAVQGLLGISMQCRDRDTEPSNPCSARVARHLDADLWYRRAGQCWVA